MISNFKRVIITVLQCTWGLIQTLIGAVMTLVLIKRRHFIYRGSIATEWGRGESLSLGLFVFISGQSSDAAKAELTAHEYGHCVQSMVLGPLYLPVIGIPSALWCMLPPLEKRRRARGLSYYSFYTERWANSIAEKLTGIRFEILK